MASSSVSHIPLTTPAPSSTVSTDPGMRLRHAALAALAANPKSWDGAKDDLYRRVKGDAEVLWLLFSAYRSQASQVALTEAAGSLRKIPPSNDRASHEPRHAFVDGGGRHAGAGEGQGQVVARPRMTGAETRAGLTAAAGVYRKSLLDTFMIDGLPLGDLTPREAGAAANRLQRNANFIRILIRNLPLDEQIRKNVNEDAVWMAKRDAVAMTPDQIV